MSLRVSRRTFALSAATLAASALLPRDAWADDVSVPLALQAKLSVKVAAYDRNMSARAGNLAKILILENSNSASSAAAAKLERGLAALPGVGPIPMQVRVQQFQSASQVADTCHSERISIIYITPGMGPEVAPLAAALDGISVLSVSAVADYGAKGAVVGFDLVDGRPKILVNLGQAKKQHVQLQSNFLKLTKIVGT